jgi:hypothetical protein
LNTRLNPRLNPHRPTLLTLTLLSLTAAAQTTQPALRSADVIKAEIETAHQQFNQAVKDPADVSDPIRRAKIAPQAIPPLKTMVADFAELARQDPHLKTRASQLQLQFNGFLIVLNDQPTIDLLQSQTKSPDPAQSLRAQSSQLLAQWVLAGKDETAQSKIADQIQTLDQANPTNEDLTYLTFTVSQSTNSQSLSQRLLQTTKQMQTPLANKIRQATNKP